MNATQDGIAKYMSKNSNAANNGYDQCSVHPSIGKVKNKVETNLPKSRPINKTNQLV